MQHNLDYFIHQRAESLAMVYLTRSKDLLIERTRVNNGIDMLITILQDNLPTGRIFGIEVKGLDKAFKDIQQEALWILSKEQKKDYVQELPFPLCLMVFTMDDDKGYYRWLRYSNELNHNSLLQEEWHSLDDYPVNQLTDAVNAWYDEKRHSAA